MIPNILYEDESILVCIKPAGIPTQTKQIRTPDMVSILKNHLMKSTPSKSSPYLAVIHRLDQPVEGLLVFAKTPNSAKELNKQLQNEGFGKYYQAAVHGCPNPTEGELHHFLVKNGHSNTSSVCTKDTPNAKHAALRYKVLSTLSSTPAKSLVEIHLETGRHHQIRVQLSHIGHPIIGDKKYGSPDDNSPQLQLFACLLEFKHPRTKKHMEFIHTPSIT